MKGLWDSCPENMAVLVTGSARLETFRQSGDSLAGRYLHHRLFPLTPAEMVRVGEPATLSRFLERGGFSDRSGRGATADGGSQNVGQPPLTATALFS
jgi:uncharacterized protein